MPMTGVRNRATYNKLLEGYRDKPGNYMAAGRFAGVDARTARKVWHKGWLALGSWGRPISEVITEEREKALAAQAERAQRDKAEAEEERARAGAESVKVRTEEEYIKGKCRAVIRDQLALVSDLTKAGAAFARKVLTEACEEQILPSGEKIWVPRDPNLIKGGVRDAMLNLDRLTKISGRTLEIAAQVLEQGRLDRGEPGTILGVQVMPDLTPDEALVVIEEQDAVLEIIRREAEEKREKSIKRLPGLARIGAPREPDPEDEE